MNSSRDALSTRTTCTKQHASAVGTVASLISLTGVKADDLSAIFYESLAGLFSLPLGGAVLTDDEVKELQSVGFHLVVSPPAPFFHLLTLSVHFVSALLEGRLGIDLQEGRAEGDSRR